MIQSKGSPLMITGRKGNREKIEAPVEKKIGEWKQVWGNESGTCLKANLYHILKHFIMYTKVLHSIINICQYLYPCRLEKEYNTLKTKEHEDQVELRVSKIKIFCHDATMKKKIRTISYIAHCAMYKYGKLSTIKGMVAFRVILHP